MQLWPTKPTQQSLAVFCTLLLAATPSFGRPQAQPAPSAQPAAGNQLLSADQLDSLVAPLALYPDPVLSQVLVASTYPLEIVEADRWYKQNTGLKGQTLIDAAAKQPWDASIQALVALPDLLQQLDQNINWTTDVGNAFLAQESDVMAAVQRMRQKAQQNGKLQSTPQQTVSSVSEGGGTYIEIQPANPQVVYVPQYDPAYIWGPAAYYPYPAYYYPHPLAYGAISFGAGFAIGALWSNGGGWGWRPGWGSHNVVVNNNFFTRNNFNHINTGNGVWAHNATHRQGVPYRNAGVANRYNNMNVNRGGGNNINVNRGNQFNRPTVNQTQQRLNQMNRQNPGINPGNAGRGGALPGQRPNMPQTPNLGGQGGANRIQPGGGSRPTPNLPQMNQNGRFGGANRQMPSMNRQMPSMNRQMPSMNRGGFGGGRPSGGGFGGGGGSRGGGRRR